MVNKARKRGKITKITSKKPKTGTFLLVRESSIYGIKNFIIENKWERGVIREGE